MISYKIYGMHSRDGMISNLKNELGLSDEDVYYDDRPNGGLALYTAKKAWLSPIVDGETHRVVFPDDIDVCNGFQDICEVIVKNHPDSIVSFFLWEGRKKDNRLEYLPSPYIKSQWCIGAGIMMPVKYIDECFTWIKKTYNDNIADDAAVQYWASNRGIPIISTIPSLVQHLGDVSLLDPSNPIRISQYFQKNPVANWDTSEIVTLPPDDKFAPYKKRIVWR